jgi:membrane-bound ClpP family serine protease
LLGTVLTILLFLYIAFKTGTWKKVMLNNSVISRVEYGLNENKINVGDTGETITRLNPIGKVMINDQVVEGKSVGGFINEKTKVEVIKIQTNNIIVKQLN